MTAYKINSRGVKIVRNNDFEGGSTSRNRLIPSTKQTKIGVGHHPGMLGQHETEWGVNMVRNLQVIGGYRLSSGGITGTVVDIRIVLGMALKCLASGIIIAHTHPSGELSPSKQDLDLTVRLMEAGKLMEIQLLDHLIITGDAYLSMAEDDLI